MDEIEMRDIIRVLWKRKWILLLVPIIFGVGAFIASKQMTPNYVSTSKVMLGNFKDTLYTQPQAVEQFIRSKDQLEPIRKKLDLAFESAEQFKQSIKINTVAKTTLIQIEANYSDPATAKKIVEELTNHFLQESESAYQQQRQPIEKLLDLYRKQYEETLQSLDRNKTALTSIETNRTLSNTEKDLTRARLLDYVINDERRMNELNAQIHQIQMQLSELNNATVIEQASLPSNPTSPRTLLNMMIALMIGFLMTILGVFIVEYLENNPIVLQDKSPQETITKEIQK